jgi:hypothetical protein
MIISSFKETVPTAKIMKRRMRNGESESQTDKDFVGGVDSMFQKTYYSDILLQ